MGSIKKQPGSVNFQNSLTIKDLCLDVSCYFWLLWRSKYNDLKVGKMSITDFECFSNKLMYDVYKLTSDEIQYIENQQIV
ncbi:MAG: hypothetical protein ACLU18_12680 [Bacteroides thetaiotaomicron]